MSSKKRHDPPSPHKGTPSHAEELQPMCRDFLKGNCPSGSKCLFPHRDVTCWNGSECKKRYCSFRHPLKHDKRYRKSLSPTNSALSPPSSIKTEQQIWNEFKAFFSSKGNILHIESPSLSLIPGFPSSVIDLNHLKDLVSKHPEIEWLEPKNQKDMVILKPRDQSIRLVHVVKNNSTINSPNDLKPSNNLVIGNDVNDIFKEFNKLRTDMDNLKWGAATGPTVNILRLHGVKKLYSRFGSIYPEGFTSTVRFISCFDTRKYISYTNQILPFGSVEVSVKDSMSTRHFKSESVEGAWNLILEQTEEKIKNTPDSLQFSKCVGGFEMTGLRQAERLLLDLVMKDSQYKFEEAPFGTMEWKMREEIVVATNQITHPNKRTSLFVFYKTHVRFISSVFGPLIYVTDISKLFLASSQFLAFMGILNKQDSLTETRNQLTLPPFNELGALAWAKNIEYTTDALIRMKDYLIPADFRSCLRICKLEFRCCVSPTSTIHGSKLRFFITDMTGEKEYSEGSSPYLALSKLFETEEIIQKVQNKENQQRVLRWVLAPEESIRWSPHTRLVTQKLCKSAGVLSPKPGDTVLGFRLKNSSVFSFDDDEISAAAFHAVEEVVFRRRLQRPFKHLLSAMRTSDELNYELFGLGTSFFWNVEMERNVPMNFSDQQPVYTFQTPFLLEKRSVVHQNIMKVISLDGLE